MNSRNLPPTKKYVSFIQKTSSLMYTEVAWMKNWVKNNNFCVVTYIDPEPWKEKCWTPWWIFCWRTAMQPLLALLWVCIEQVSNAIAYFTKTFKVHFLGLNYFKWADNCTRRSEMESFKGLIPLQFVYINTFSKLFGAFH